MISLCQPTTAVVHDKKERFCIGDAKSLLYKISVSVISVKLYLS